MVHEIAGGDAGQGSTGSASQLASGGQTGERGFSFIDVLAAVALIGVVAAIAVPMTTSAVNGHRFSGDAKALTNMVGLAKMRASAAFTRARVRADIAAGTFVLERWDRASNQWIAEDGQMRLFREVTFGFGDLAAAPPNTQTAIQFSPPCRTRIGTGDETIDGTACIVFNSRGLPVDGLGNPYGGHALYMTDGSLVAATTVTATPRIRRWVSSSRTANWKEQQ